MTRWYIHREKLTALLRKDSLKGMNRSHFILISFPFHSLSSDTHSSAELTLWGSSLGRDFIHAISTSAVRFLRIRGPHRKLQLPPNIEEFSHLELSNEDGDWDRYRSNTLTKLTCDIYDIDARSEYLPVLENNLRTFASAFPNLTSSRIRLMCYNRGDAKPIYDIVDKVLKHKAQILVDMPGVDMWWFPIYEELPDGFLLKDMHRKSFRKIARQHDGYLMEDKLGVEHPDGRLVLVLKACFPNEVVAEKALLAFTANGYRVSLTDIMDENGVLNENGLSLLAQTSAD